MTHPLFAPELRYVLESNDTEAMQEFCETLHPATLAETLADDFTVEDDWRVLNTTSIANQAEIFSYFPLEWQVKMVEGTGRQHMARLIEKMGHDDRADLLRKLTPQVADSLLRLVDEADRRDIARLVTYPENSAGSIMTTDYAWLPGNITVEDAIDRLRLMAPDRETIYYLYIVDDQRRLLGVVSLRELILAPKRKLLSEVMGESVVTVKVSDDVEKVAQDMARFDLLAVPVVDDDNRLVGIITHDDVIDVVVEEATEDVHRMGAVGPLEANYLEASLFTIWRNRAFWLSMLFLAELFTFSALAYFEDAIAEVVVLSLFVPLCISTGGNSGSQAATLITRAMALGQVSNRDWLRVLRHELIMGLVLGLTLGAIGFIRASFTPESVRSSAPARPEPFEVRLASGTELRQDENGNYLLPAGTVQTMREDHNLQVHLPEDGKLERVEDEKEPGMVVYRFPRNCSVLHPPVPRYHLALVIALAVAAICLWGTLMGSMLPLIFKSLGVDPGIASSPFVATFVDVTGIMIYFTIAKMVLWQMFV
jgi:magnesium transporter